MAKYEDNLCAVLKMQGEMVESCEEAIEWGIANEAPAEWLELYREMIVDSLEFIENLLDTHFEALGDDLPNR